MTYDSHSCREIATLGSPKTRTETAWGYMRVHANYAVIWSTQVAKEMQRGFLAARIHTLRSLMFRLLWPESMIDLKNAFNENSLEH